MFSGIGLTEILIILSVILLLFGGRKIPQLARDLGTGLREFKRSLTSARDNIELEAHEHSSDEGIVFESVRKKNSVPKKTAKKKSAKAKSKKA